MAVWRWIQVSLVIFCLGNSEGIKALGGLNFIEYHEIELKAVIYIPFKAHVRETSGLNAPSTDTYYAVFPKTPFNFNPSIAFTDEVSGRWSTCKNLVTPELQTNLFVGHHRNGHHTLRNFTLEPEIIRSASESLFACYKIKYENGSSSQWIHSGLLVNFPSKSLPPNDLTRTTRRKRNDVISNKLGTTKNKDFINDTDRIIIQGLTISSPDDIHKFEIGEEGLSILANSDATLRLFGSNFLPSFKIKFTVQIGKRDERCDEFSSTISFEVKSKSDDGTGTVIVNLPASPTPYYICVEHIHPQSGLQEWIHQGSASYTIVSSHSKLLPLWLQICIIMALLLFSGLFSGLNLGLMAMDKTELKIVSSVGTESEKKWAKAIMPVRKRGNYLLCSLLLGNVLVNSTLTLCLDDISSGVIAIVVSTLSIVVIGEIIPQAICSRHGLAVGAKTVIITKFFMVLTFPLSFPISLLLDAILGEEIGNVYNRERLKELIKVTNEYNDLEKDEVNIIAGTLELKKKQVSEVMTKLEDMFMLPSNAILNFETVSLIMEQGYSRIPVYDDDPHNVVDLLFIKDLAFIDPDDEIPLKQLCQFHKNPINFVFEDTRLDVMLKEFKTGAKGHMAFVQRVNTETECDPYYEVIGLVTLEDVIEEMIQSEIVDETDIFYDNKSRKRITTRKAWNQDFSSFAQTSEKQKVQMSPHLLLATFQYLSTTVEPFQPPLIANKVLNKLLKQDIVKHVKLKSKNERPAYLYEIGKPADYFILILEGRVEVMVGKECMLFESGPFTYFGLQALVSAVANQEVHSSGIQPSSTRTSFSGPAQSISMDSVKTSFIPDYSVKPITDVLFLSIKQQHYIAALRATKFLQKQDKITGSDDDQVDIEIEMMLEKIAETPTIESPAIFKKNNYGEQNSFKDLTQVHDLKLHDVSQSLNLDRITSVPNGELEVVVESPTNHSSHQESPKVANEQSKSVNNSVENGNKDNVTML